MDDPDYTAAVCAMKTSALFILMTDRNARTEFVDADHSLRRSLISFADERTQEHTSEERLASRAAWGDLQKRETSLMAALIAAVDLRVHRPEAVR